MIDAAIIRLSAIEITTRQTFRTKASLTSGDSTGLPTDSELPLGYLVNRGVALRLAL
jgi:hypothetical protein